MDYTFHAIGLIRSPFSDPGETPIQSARSQSPGQVILNPEYAPGLQDLECFSHIILLYAFHRSQGYSLLVQPFLDDIQHGLFSTRYRPNPLGLSVVQLDEVCDNVLKISGVDVLDGTPCWISNRMCRILTCMRNAICPLALAGTPLACRIWSVFRISSCCTHFIAHRDIRSSNHFWMTSSMGYFPPVIRFDRTPSAYRLFNWMKCAIMS
jgi:tRNA (adenine37-N6)-methyltransferase